MKGEHQDVNQDVDKRLLALEHKLDRQTDAICGFVTLLELMLRKRVASRRSLVALR